MDLGVAWEEPASGHRQQPIPDLVLNPDPQPCATHPLLDLPAPTRGVGRPIQDHPGADRDLRRDPAPCWHPSTRRRAGSIWERPKVAGVMIDSNSTTGQKNRLAETIAEGLEADPKPVGNSEVGDHVITATPRTLTTFSRMENSGIDPVRFQIDDEV